MEPPQITPPSNAAVVGTFVAPSDITKDMEVDFANMMQMFNIMCNTCISDIDMTTPEEDLTTSAPAMINEAANAQADTTMQDDPEINLLTMAPELRNKILSLTLLHLDPITFIYNHTTKTLYVPTQLGAPAAGACKQLQDEWGDAFYTHNDFQVLIDYDETPEPCLRDVFQEIIDSISPSGLRKMRTLTLTFSGPAIRPDLHIERAMSAGASVYEQCQVPFKVEFHFGHAMLKQAAIAFPNFMDSVVKLNRSLCRQASDSNGPLGSSEDKKNFMLSVWAMMLLKTGEEIVALYNSHSVEL